MRAILPAVVLAAGRSRRMGRPKALLPTDRPGETFVGRIVRMLREGGSDDVIVVAGAEAPAIRAELSALPLPPRVVVNPQPDDGQLSSLLVGLSAVDRPGVNGLLVTLVDVPLIDADTVQRLRAAYDETRAPVVRPARGARHGHPVIFDRALFDELRQVDPSVGAKPVVRAHLEEIVDVPIDREGPFLDVDTPAAYARVFGRTIPDETGAQTGARSP